MYEIIKSARGMNDWDYVWGDDHNEEDLIKRLNHNNFPNPWHDPEAWGLNDATTPVGYFNGTTYQYPEGIECVNPDFETIYQLVTENIVSPYGLYDINGNIADLTSSFSQIGWPHGATHIYTIGSTFTSAWNAFQSSRRTYIDHGGSNTAGFRVARTVNTASSTSTSKSSSKIK